ncbi:MAG TPA: hypothetical protein VM120_13735 [Bryobacteraceae bacterium]|nr:hypothetical protein [Bryobacteraceae bacterium]
MTVTLQLSPDIEARLREEARARGVSLDMLLERLAIGFAHASRKEEPQSTAAYMFQMKGGICALEVGRRISADDVNTTLDALRLERDLLNLGTGH